MKLPILGEIRTSREMIDAFSGYNHNLRINEGEFYDMENLTGEHFPVLSPRDQRGVYATPTNPQGLIVKDALCYVDGTDFVINEYRVPMGLSTAEDKCPKRMVSMGAYVIILPDKKYINTADISDYGSIEASVTTTSTVTFELCKNDGSLYSDTIVSATEPETKNNLDLWIDTSTIPHSLKQYSDSSAMWVTIATTYIKISATGIGELFADFDGVTISGVKDLTDLNNTMVIQARGDDFIVVVGMLDVLSTQTEPITIERKMPDMDFVIESNNRLWGCKYGITAEDGVLNEIYASKLGDFKNWRCYMGISTDSYTASCGTDGPFTGAISHLGYPIFFKENYLHKVYGNFPSNFQIQTTECRGVQKSSSNSLAIVNEVLYYKSRGAVCAYDGSLPIEVSAALGDVLYSDAIACGHNNKYYISMKNSDKWTFFVLDTVRGIWHKEDNLHPYAICPCDDDIYYIDYDDRKIKSLFGSGTKDTTPVKWYAETGVLGLGMPDRKYISKLNVTMSLNTGSRVFFYIQYDSIGEWIPITTVSGYKLDTYVATIKAHRCGHFRLRIVGEGEAKIYSITKTIEQGSDT